MTINMDQIPIRAVRNVYLNNNAYICSGSQSPPPFLSREVPHSYRPREKHETEVVLVTRRFYYIYALCAMRYAHRPKIKNKDSMLIKNWRPISLINVDVKVASKALAEKMKKVIHGIIHCDQTAYVKGRYIGESVRLIDDL